MHLAALTRGHGCGGQLPGDTQRRSSNQATWTAGPVSPRQRGCEAPAGLHRQQWVSCRPSSIDCGFTWRHSSLNELPAHCTDMLASVQCSRTCLCLRSMTLSSLPETAGAEARVHDLMRAHVCPALKHSALPRKACLLQPADHFAGLFLYRPWTSSYCCTRLCRLQCRRSLRCWACYKGARRSFGWNVLGMSTSCSLPLQTGHGPELQASVL